MKGAALIVLLVTLFGRSHQHGYMFDPPMRSTAWRYGFPTEPNYTDNELNCGGYANQWQNNDGMCGECGDPWEVPVGQRPNQAGGIYASGVITGTYQAGQIADIGLKITAMHWGWYEFRVCQVPNKDTAVTWDCLNANQLQFADGSYRYEIPSEYSPGDYTLQVRMPDFACDHCVLQWWWFCGNSWGKDPDGTECVGCGAQENFINCADITILSGDGGGETTTTTTTTASTTTTAATTTTSGTGTTTTTTTTTTATTTTPAPPTPSPWPSQVPDVECQWIGEGAPDESLDLWCYENCTHVPSNCPTDTCQCTQNPVE